MKFWRTPFDAETSKVPHGELHIILERCKGCGFCVTYCPRGVLEMSNEINSKGYHPPKVIDESQCVNCDLCEMICPEFAIFSIRKEPESQIEV